MKQVIIYPGRFQPMLSHHAEVYSQLQSQFPEADVYIGTSDKVESGKSPFTFKEKQLIAQAHGIDPSKILQAKRPYHKDDYPFDEDNTVIIFAVGEKDMDRFPFSNVDSETGLDMTVKDNSKPKYYQKINTYRTDPKPMAERGYITLAPTISVDNEVASASAFRDALKNAPDKESAEQVYTKQFGNFDPKIFELIYGKITGQNDMNEELNKIRKLAGMQPLTESFDPSMEPNEESTMFNDAMDAYDDHGEDGLAQHLGMSSQEFDQELNELGAEKGLHADDDRDELVQLLVQDLIDNREVEQHESIEENAGEYSYTLEYNGEENGYSIHKLTITSPEGETKEIADDFTYFDQEGDELQAELESWFNKGMGVADASVDESLEEDEEGEKVITVNKPITLAGDSIWDKDDSKNPESVNVESVTVTQSTDEGGDYAHVSVSHNGPWTVYTDSGFEEAISEVVGFEVMFTEQGMQEEGQASLEGNISDKGQNEDIDRMRHLAGLEEAEMPDFDKGERPSNSKERAAYRKWKKDQATGQKDDDAPLTISPKDRKDAEARPANAAAANPATVGFGVVKPQDMTDKRSGKPIPSMQRAKSIANQFPEGADINDPAIKKEVFLKFTAKRPDLMFGEINARLANDDEGLAASDRLSPIVRQLEDSRNIMELEPEDKSFALKILNNAIQNMELVKATDIDKQIEVEPMQMDTEDEPEIGDDDMVPVLDMEDDDEFEKESIDLSSIRDEYGISEDEDEENTEEKLEDMIKSHQFKIDDNHPDEINVQDHEDAIDWYEGLLDQHRKTGEDTFHAPFGGDTAWREMIQQEMEDIDLYKPHGQGDMRGFDDLPEEEIQEGKMKEIIQDLQDMSKEEFCSAYPQHEDDYEELRKQYSDDAPSDVIEDIVDEAVENTIDVAISELKQLAGI